MAACQPTNQPPQRTRRSRAHTFRISQIPIAQCAAFSAPHPPRVLSLAAFGRRPLLYVAPMSLAGIRNPQQERTHAPQQTDSEKYRSGVKLPLLMSPRPGPAKNKFPWGLYQPKLFEPKLTAKEAE